MAGNVIELTDATFEETISGDTPVLVDFWAPWCGPCKMIAPMIAEISEEYDGKAVICKIDTDEQREAAVKHGISAIPTIILFQSGEVKNKWVGLTSKDDLTAAIDELA